MYLKLDRYWRFDVLHEGQDGVVSVCRCNSGHEEFMGTSFSSYCIRIVSHEISSYLPELRS